MTLRRTLSVGVGVVLAGVVLSLVVGGLLGQPLLLSYVETGSMEPTMSAGDGFVAVPAPLAGEIEPGDIVVFEAEQLHGGGLTTHRVVEETDRGFRTRGDANPFTDQDDGEPPVRREQIVAVAWQPGGSVLAIPKLGTAIESVQTGLRTVQVRLASLLGTRALLGTQGLAYLLLGATGALYLLDRYRTDDRADGHTRQRETGTSTRLLVGTMVAVVVIAMTAAMAVPAGSQEVTLVSADFESDSPTVVERGSNATLTRPVGNGGFVPVVVFLEPGSEAVTVQPREFQVGPRSVVNATLTLSVPPETGAYRRYVTQHRYLSVLPQSVIRTLHGIHAWLPVVVIDALVAVPLYLLGVRLVGTGRIRSRSRERPSRLGRLWRRYR